MSDINGLEMHGLSREMEAICRATHNAFLEQHGIKHWPTSVTVIQQAPTICVANIASVTVSGFISDSIGTYSPP